MNRQDQCPNCMAFYCNWDEEVAETMEQAPGEECSLSQNTFKQEPCPFYTVEEE